MAAATNGDAASGPSAVLDEIKPPQGVVLPPKEFRSKSPPFSNCVIMQLLIQYPRCVAILEKTAGFVARNGLAFEGTYYFIPHTYLKTNDETLHFYAMIYYMFVLLTIPSTLI